MIGFRLYRAYVFYENYFEITLNWKSIFILNNKCWMLNNMIYLYKLAFIRITKFIIWSWTFNLHDTLFQYRPFSHCIFNIFLETMNIYMNIYIQEVQDSIILQKSFRFFDPIINYQIKFLYIKFHSSKEICSSIDSPCYLKFKCLSKNLNGIKIGCEKESSLIFNKWHQLFHVEPILTLVDRHTVTTYTNNFISSKMYLLNSFKISNGGRSCFFVFLDLYKFLQMDIFCSIWFCFIFWMCQQFDNCKKDLSRTCIKEVSRKES